MINIKLLKPSAIILIIINLLKAYYKGILLFV